MSSASASRTISFISKMGTFTTMLIPAKGDLYQYYTGTSDDPGTIYPNFESTQPILYFVCVSSRTTDGVATPESINFFFNNNPITFDSNGLSLYGYKGYFKKISPTSENPYYGIQFLKNIADLSLYAPATIRAEATLVQGTLSDKVQASYAIQVKQSSGGNFDVVIESGDNKHFVITKKQESIVLTAMVYDNKGAVISKGLTYQWSAFTKDGWTTADTTQSITIKEENVNGFAEFKVTVTKGSTVLGTAFHGVIDASDPYEIDAHPDPEDETISDDVTDTARSQVTYTPKLVMRGGGTAPTTLFTFVVKDSNGTIMNPEDYSTNLASYTVKRETAVAAGSSLTITIFSVV